MAIRDMRHVVNGERRSRASKVMTGGFVPELLIVTPSGWADGGTIAMRTKYLAAIAIVAAGAGLAVHSVGSLAPERQSTPAVAQLATVLAESVDPFLHRSGG